MIANVQMTYLSIVVTKFIEGRGSLYWASTLDYLTEFNKSNVLTRNDPFLINDLVQEPHYRQRAYDFSHKIISFTLSYTRSKPRLIPF